ncbi:MAG: hypothetical protein WCL54_07135 [Clostridia bacterium]
MKKKDQLERLEQLDNADFSLSHARTQCVILTAMISAYEKELSQLPDGKISRKMIGGKYYFYHFYKHEDGIFRQKSIGKNETLSEQLKRRVFLLAALARLRKDLTAFERFIDSYDPFFAEDIIQGNLIPFEKMHQQFFDKKEKIKAWISEPFDCYELYQDGLIQTSPGGLKVRSKSEALIAGLLETNQIPFRYEAKLIVGNKTFFPDFTIMRPKDGEIMYWEHFGKIGDPQYDLSMVRKLQNYVKDNVIPWENLIMTFDSKNGSIDASLILGIIKTFLMSP